MPFYRLTVCRRWGQVVGRQGRRIEGVGVRSVAVPEESQTKKGRQRDGEAKDALPGEVQEGKFPLLRGLKMVYRLVKK
jgi:hypothetical protein